MSSRVRPLSPHLEIYRWQISNTLSILHRLCGLALSVGFVVFALWLIAVARGPRAFAVMTSFLRSVVGELIWAGWAFAFCFHLLNGIRHLFWDAGLGFDKRRSRASGWWVVAGTIVGGASIIAWVLR